VRALSCRQTIAAWLSAFIYLKHLGKQRLWLAACTWGSSHWFGGDVVGGVLERSLRLTETAGYSPWLNQARGGVFWHGFVMVLPCMVCFGVRNWLFLNTGIILVNALHAIWTAVFIRGTATAEVTAPHPGSELPVYSPMGLTIFASFSWK
jgi:hypothetical protein